MAKKRQDESREMLATNSLDIVNAEKNKWGDADWLNYGRNRIVLMRAKRSEYDRMCDEFQVQENAVSFYDNDGNLQWNVPMEKSLGEIYMGRNKGKVEFDIVPDEQASVEELMPTKFAMQFFLDGNAKDTFWKEWKMVKEDKKTYGSGYLYTGIRSYQDWRYVQKDGEAIEGDTDILDEGKFDRVNNETWFFFPKRIHPKDFFIDDAAYGQQDVQYADDCCFKEKLTPSEFNQRYAHSDVYKNTKDVTYWQDINPKNKDDKSIEQRHVVVYHYFHRITKKYLIIANEAQLIFSGRYLYDDGKLPFVNIQHYTRNDRFQGEGIPERVFFLKTSKNDVWRDIMNGAAMSSGVNLLVGNDDQVGQDWTVGGRGLNLWRTTGGADKVQPISTSPNLSYFAAVLDLIDKETTIAAGEDQRAAIEAKEATLGQQEILEGNRAIRKASVDENTEIGLDDALTMMLSRIKQFAPALLATKIPGEDGKTLRYVFPKIKIDGYTVKKRKGKQEFVKSLGKYGYFELKPDVVKGVGVKITTASTNSMLPIMERRKITEYVNNLTSIAQMAQFDATGQIAQQLVESIDVKGLMSWAADAYGYEKNHLHADTEKDKIAKKNQEKIGMLREMITNQAANAQAIPQAAPQAEAPQPQGAGVPSQAAFGSVGGGKRPGKVAGAPSGIV
jgi:hypothetical protein